MMKKLTRTRILSLVVVAGLLCGTAFAASAVTTRMIEANYMGIRIVVDGKEIINNTDIHAQRKAHKAERRKTGNSGNRASRH